MRAELIAAAAVLATIAWPTPAFRLPGAVRRRLPGDPAAREQRRVAEQLPMVVAELAANVRAGRSLATAVEGAAGDVPEPAASRLRAASARIGLGDAPASALAALGSSAEVTLLTTAVELQTRVGGDLAVVLDRLSDTMLDRRAERRAADALTAQARATARMVSGLPVAGLAMLWVVDRPATGALLGSPAGWLSLAASAGLTLLARAIVRRLSAVT